ncbi:uncharacterized protein MONBRDRAFT_30321 [Monosiga brevicollis MX1]|uniref:Sulfotransferase domain-containing protein n=1 Tax=Monosiga brevicollis TaxID=81824 RepID=A9VDM5_MONBE|nr:uncharacterized protein MONBRDRAFT_30321 [Monosiga brevicollis MX1]EDQ84325.1 predicted protein [Monosiga brevicollis MX1]|eukprot:XP_001750821.1 hypothetical protein [Monosiga brevicollis MX1]
MRCLAVALGLGLSLGMVDWVAGGAVLDFEFEAPEWFEGEVWESQDPADIRDVLLLNNVSTIGMKQRPLLRSSQNISPDQLDAGVCMSDDSSSSFKAACLPSFLIIGAMKAGTGELASWLEQSPLLRRYTNFAKPTWHGEAHYFDHIQPTETLEDTWRSYLWTGPKYKDKDQLRTTHSFDKTPNYLLATEAQLEMMHRLLPSVRMIATLRNPTDRAFSQYQQECRQGFVLIGKSPAVKGRVTYARRPDWALRTAQRLGLDNVSKKDFETAKFPCSNDHFLAMLTGNGTGPDIDLSRSLAFRIISNGYYREQLDRVLALYPRNQLHVLLHEAFMHNPIAEMEKIEDFLGVPRMPYANMTRITDSGFIALKNVRSKADKLRYEKLSPSTREKLDRLYRPHNQGLLDFFDKEQLRKTWHISL